MKRISGNEEQDLSKAMHDLTLADKLGATRQTVLAIEKGKYDPSLELASKISRLFETEIEDILVYEENLGS